jgi:hypothetical protein
MRRMFTILRQLAARAFVLGAVALVAVGVSGGVAAGLGAVAGHRFVAGDPPGVTYSAARCSEFREYVPQAGTCEQAATEHHFGEVVEYRAAAGVLGLVLLAGYAVARRQRPQWFAVDRLPTAFDITVATTAYGIAAAFLIGYAFDQMLLKYDGAGLFLSGGIVAAACAIFFAARFVRVITAPAPLGP